MFFVWLVWQFYLQIKFQFETEVVHSSEVKKEINVLGVIFKDEHILDYGNDSAIVKNMFKDGERVSRYSEVAKKYASESEIKNLDDLKKMDEKINSLSELQKSNLSNQSFGSLNKQIYGNYFELLNCLKIADGQALLRVKDKIVNNFNKRQLLTGKVKDFRKTIENLKKERASIAKSVSLKYKSIYTPYAGYFVNSVDGFEKQCSLNKINEFDASGLKELCNLIEKCDSTKNNVEKINEVGKIIVNPRIIFKALMPKSFYIDFKVGSQCWVKFEQTGEELLAKLIDFNFDLNKGDSVATFEISCVTNKLASMRKSRANVSFNKYYGLKLNKSAIRKNNYNQLGVYVLVGASLRFKLIDILVEDKDFVISKIHDEDNAYLKELDEIVVKGKDLYERKKIKKI